MFETGKSAHWLNKTFLRLSPRFLLCFFFSQEALLVPRWFQSVRAAFVSSLELLHGGAQHDVTDVCCGLTEQLRRALLVCCEDGVDLFVSCRLIHRRERLSPLVASLFSC